MTVLSETILANNLGANRYKISIMGTASSVTGYLQELEKEAIATRKCLEKIPASKFEFKPHPTSMNMGYLSSLVAEIPRWIAVMIEDGEIDFATFNHPDIKSTQDLLDYFDNNMQQVRKALKNVSSDDLEKVFSLKRDGQIIFSVKWLDYIGPTINHWIHHRGQLTVYMRVSEIPVPSVYGPSGDDKNF